MKDKSKVDTPWENSWAHQMETRIRQEISEEEKRFMRAGIVHPSLRNGYVVATFTIGHDKGVKPC